MLKKIQDHIEREELFAPNDRILLAVSGGIDSMVMVHVFQSMGVTIGVAHCNFQLRDEESDQDEAFVREYCHRHQLPFFGQRFDTNNYATEHKLSIQMAARELRYIWFDQLLRENNYQFLATAHHLDDSLETSLLNFVRGTGPRGISGIAAKNGQRIRPLLHVTRTEIANYAEEYQIAWREDISNRSLDYSRNVIRQKIVPYLKELNPSLEASFSQFVNRMEGANELMGVALNQWKDQHWQEESGRILIQKKGLLLFENRASVLYELIKEFGFNLSQCHEVLNAMEAQAGKRFLSDGFELVVDRDQLIVKPVEPEPITCIISRPDQQVSNGYSFITFRVENNKGFSHSSQLAFIDHDLLRWPLVWRTWHAGDVFHPLGMPHRKKISDFLIDQKISRADKDRITVLQSGDDIVWIVGLRLDDRFKVSDKTTQVLVAEVKPIKQ